MRPSIRTIILTSSLVLLSHLSSAVAHEGHDHAPGEEPSVPSFGPIEITKEAKRNLGLTVEEADVRSLDHVLTVIGQIEPIPSQSAAITSRISGRVLALKVVEGESVQKGQSLIEVESRQLGDPPPRVDYKSPLDGVVIDRHAVLGDTVEPDKHLLEVVNLSSVYAEGRIFEGQVAQIKTGQQVRISVDSYPREKFTGTVEIISGALDSESRTLKVWARVANPDGRLRPNMRATLSIVVSETESSVTIPQAAVLGEAGDFFAFVETDGNELEYTRRSLVLGARDDRYIEVIEGILPGDKVVTVGNYQLQYVKPKPKEASTENAEHAPTKDTSASLFLALLTLSVAVNIAILVAYLRLRKVSINA